MKDITMQIPNGEYTETLVNYAIGNQLPDCGMVNENAVLIDYAMTSAKPACWYFTPYTQITTNDILFNALQAVWSGEQTARKAIDAVYDELCEAIVVE